MRARIEAEADGRLDGTAAPPDFAVSETPSYLGRGVAALATDPEVSRFARRTRGSVRLASGAGTIMWVEHDYKRGGNLAHPGRGHQALGTRPMIQSNSETIRTPRPSVYSGRMASRIASANRS